MTCLNPQPGPRPFKRRTDMWKRCPATVKGMGGTRIVHFHLVDKEGKVLR